MIKIDGVIKMNPIKILNIYSKNLAGKIKESKNKID